eukprot:gene17253-biopygen17320
MRHLPLTPLICAGSKRRRRVGARGPGDRAPQQWIGDTFGTGKGLVRCGLQLLPALPTPQGSEHPPQPQPRGGVALRQNTALQLRPIAALGGSRVPPSRAIYWRLRGILTKFPYGAPSRNGMPRRSFFEAFLEHFEGKTTEFASKHAPQRRVYARSVQKGPIDGTH